MGGRWGTEWILVAQKPSNKLGPPESWGGRRRSGLCMGSTLHCRQAGQAPVTACVTCKMNVKYVPQWAAAPAQRPAVAELQLLSCALCANPVSTMRINNADLSQYNHQQNRLRNQVEKKRARNKKTPEKIDTHFLGSLLSSFNHTCKSQKQPNPPPTPSFSRTLPMLHPPCSSKTPRPPPISHIPQTELVNFATCHRSSRPQINRHIKRKHSTSHHITSHHIHLFRIFHARSLCSSRKTATGTGSSSHATSCFPRIHLHHPTHTTHSVTDCHHCSSINLQLPWLNNSFSDDYSKT